MTDWRALYDRAAVAGEAASGYYNHNVRLEGPDGPVNVRIPMPAAEIMDLRIWDEAAVLRGVGTSVERVPVVLHESLDPPFQVHEFIEGDILNDVAPRSRPVPSHVIADIVQFFAQLVHVPPHALPATPPLWPTGSDTAGFGRALEAMTNRIHAGHRDEFASLYAGLGVPEDPLVAITAAWDELTPRPLVCVHADIHRKNLIVADGRTYLLDWELALWGDPVYDLAVHLHKMSYLNTERDELVSGWLRALPAELTVAWEDDLDLYLAHEQLKSAIVDSVRSCRAYVEPSYSPEPNDVVVGKLTDKLNRARRHWGSRSLLTTDAVEAQLRAWAHQNDRR